MHADEDRRMQEKRNRQYRGFININIFDPFQFKYEHEIPESNLIKSLLQHQNKQKILFPYNFK